MTLVDQDTEEISTEYMVIGIGKEVPGTFICQLVCSQLERLRCQN